jgi:PKD repeat protein
MKRTLFSLALLISMLFGMVSSASATSTLSSQPVQQVDQLIPERLVIRLYFTSKEDLNNLAARYDILNVNQSQGYAQLLVSPDEFTTLQQAGYRLEVEERQTELLNQPRQILPGQGIDSIPGFPCYRTVEETYTDIQALATAHPDMAQVFDIGDSWTKVQMGFPNGYDILALRLSNENFGNINDKPTFFLMAEIHAREYATAELATRFGEYLINNYGFDPDVTWLLDYFRVYIVTMTNPDGRKIAEGGNMWRKNVDNDDGCTYSGYWGTDLNRNSTFKWNTGGSDDDPCGETYHGPTAGSEPEVQAIQSFVLNLFPDQRGPGDTDPAPVESTGVLISLHSAAGLVLWPWGWTGTDAPNASQLQTLGRHLAYFNGYYPEQSNDLYQTSGTSDDWSYGQLGIASFTFEMAGEFFQNCSSFEGTDYPDNRNALLYAFKTARRPYMNPSGPDSLSVVASPSAANPGDVVLLTAVANDTHYASGEPTQNIAEARYSIDNPSWIADTILYAMSPSDGSFDSKIENLEAVINTSGLASGRHTIFVESKDINGNWGVPSATFLFIVEPGVSPVIEGYIREAGSNLPVEADVSAGLFNTTSDPSTGYYSMTVISGTYDMVVTSGNFAPAYANGVVAQDGQTVQQDFHLYPICDVFTDNIEGGNLGWTAQAPWAITTEASHSPTHSWTDSPGGNYQDNRNITLTSPTFDLSAATGVTLNFWHEYDTETGWDYGTVEYNADNGWTEVQSYDGFQDWTQESLSIPALDGKPNAQIRFHFTSDTNTNFDGWHFDDISITAGGPGCMAPSIPDAEFTSNSPVPLGQPMVFTNQTSGSEPITYAWDFGDSVGTSSDRDPTYTYTDIGTYTVTLDATNSLGSDTITHTVIVEPGAIASVDLTRITTDTIYTGYVVGFSADLLPDNAFKPYAYTIDFGDGMVITGTSVTEPLLFSHIYTSGGSHTIQISVINDVMAEPVTDSLDVYVNFKIFMPLTSK